MTIQKKSVSRGLTAKTKARTANRTTRKAKALKIGPGTSLVMASKVKYW